MVEYSKMAQKDEIIKAAILEAGARAFQKWGLKKTTMTDIAKEAGKAKSSLYYYYKSKEDIYYNVFKNIIDNLIDKATAEIEKVTSAEEKLKLYINILTNETKTIINLYKVIYLEIDSMIKMVEKITEYVDAKEMKFARKILSLGVKSKEFKQFNDKELNNISYIIVNSHRSLHLNVILKKKEKDFEKIPLLFNIILSGIKK